MTISRKQIIILIFCVCSACNNDSWKSPIALRKFTWKFMRWWCSFICNASGQNAKKCLVMKYLAIVETVQISIADIKIHLFLYAIVTGKYASSLSVYPFLSYMWLYGLLILNMLELVEIVISYEELVCVNTFNRSLQFVRLI